MKDPSNCTDTCNDFCSHYRMGFLLSLVSQDFFLIWKKKKTNLYFYGFKLLTYL